MNLLSSRQNAFLAVFLSGFSLMAVELSASRLIAPVLGSSLYIWTSLIGVVFGAGAFGNIIGGRIADHVDPLTSLSWISLLASCSVVMVFSFDRLISSWTVLWAMDTILHIFFHVFLLIFLPSFLFGLFVPFAGRLAVEVPKDKGSGMGGLYAAGTSGSILGTFLAGYLLIPFFGSRLTLWLTAGVLAAAAFVFRPVNRAVWLWGILLGFFFLSGESGNPFFVRVGEKAGLRTAADPNLLYADESAYSLIQVFCTSDNPLTVAMKLDKLKHSEGRPDDPRFLGYDYVRIMAAVTRQYAKDRSFLKTLSIGGGGYVLPRYLETIFPDSLHDVVEIDPAVTRAALKTFGFSPSPRLKVHHEDGRTFVNRLSEDRKHSGSYDLIYLDAVNDFCVPAQLATREFALSVRSLLKEDGLYAVNMIDILEGGRFLSVMRKTLEEVFPFVEVLVDAAWLKEGLYGMNNTFVMVASSSRFDLSDLEREGTMILPPVLLEKLQKDAPRFVLTDEYAPLESLLAPLVRTGNHIRAAGFLFDRGLAREEKGEADRSALLYNRALRLNPYLYKAHIQLGFYYETKGDLVKAEDSFSKALRILPRVAALRVNYGNVLAKQGKTSLAVQEYETAIGIDPLHADAYLNSALLFYQKGDLREAYRILLRAGRVLPDHPEIRARINILKNLLRL